MISENKKEEGICPNCGQWNFRPVKLYREKVLDDMGNERYVLFSDVKYICTFCKCVWTERWDYE